MEEIVQLKIQLDLGNHLRTIFVPSVTVSPERCEDPQTKELLVGLHTAISDYP